MTHAVCELCCVLVWLGEIRYFVEMVDGVEVWQSRCFRCDEELRNEQSISINSSNTRTSRGRTNNGKRS